MTQKGSFFHFLKATKTSLNHKPSILAEYHGNNWIANNKTLYTIIHKEHFNKKKMDDAISALLAPSGKGGKLKKLFGGENSVGASCFMGTRF